MDWKQQFQSLTLQPHEETTAELQLAYLESWKVITATGPDSKSYLQGQLTCNVVSLSEQDVTFSGHCDPKGKTWSVFRLFHHNSGYAMLQPEAVIEAELRELKKYAVFSKIELAESTDIILSVMGNSATDYINQLSQDKGNVKKIPGGTAIKISDTRWALIIEESKVSDLIANFNGKLVHENAWLCAEIKDGIPVLNKQEQNVHIPQALNLQALDGISFTKGCYTGQETVARAKYRGVNKRALFTLIGPLTESLTDVEIERSVGDNWRSVGNFLSLCPLTNGNAIGQIVLPNNLDEDSQFRIKGNDATRWNYYPQPYSLEATE